MRLVGGTAAWVGLVCALAVGVPSASAQDEVSPIPVAEVAKQSAQVPNLLRALTEPLAPNAEIDAIRQRLPLLHDQAERDMEAVEILLWDQPMFDALQMQQQLWQQRRLETSQWLALLTRRVLQLQDALNRLAQLKATWRQTRSTSVTSKTPKPILTQIDAALEAIDAAAGPLAAEHTTVLDLQSAVALEVARSETALVRLGAAQQEAMGGFFVRGSPPLWDVEAWTEARNSLVLRLRAIADARRQDVVRYVRDPKSGLRRHVMILVVLVAAFWVARHRVRIRAARDVGATLGPAVLDRPYAAALLVTLLIASSPSGGAPQSLRNLFQILALAPVLLLTRPALDTRLVPAVFTVVVLFTLDRLRHAVGGVPVLEQGLLVLQALAGMAAAALWLTFGRLRRASGDAVDAERLQAFRVGAGLTLLLLGVALVAGAVGYVRLARLIASGLFGSGALALTVYAAIRVAAGVTAVALRVWPARVLRMVQRHRPLLERRVYHALVWVGIGAWAIRSLDYLGLWRPVQSTVTTMLAAPLGRGSITFSAGNVLEFVFTIWLAYLFSSFVRFVLDEDVYPRTRVRRGTSYALSSLLNYVVIALGFLLALGALGVDLSKVTILAGAFSVGIGFGLQGVVNNFVSGLVVLFERPIQVGDIIEIGTLQGEVVRIGMRASTLRTAQGSEIIIPNAQLITDRVINWTRSDRRRRIDVRVGTDYGSAPARVVEVLETVARGHPHILKVPPPEAIFVAFGDSAINFELRAWTDQFDRWPIIATELANAVHAALGAAGMTIPFPQREVRLVSDLGPMGERHPTGVETANERPGIRAD